MASRFALGFTFFIVASCMPKHSEIPSQAAGTGASKNDTLFHCKRTLDKNEEWNKKGSMEVFLVRETPQRIILESDKSLGVPVGFSGKANNGDGISESQGGQPVVSSITEIGKRTQFEFASKKCAGKCGNHIYVASIRGDGDMSSFLDAKSMSFDTRERELTILGTLYTFERPVTQPEGKESEMRFADCDLSDTVLKNMKKELKKQ